MANWVNSLFKTNEKVHYWINEWMNKRCCSRKMYYFYPVASVPSGTRLSPQTEGKHNPVNLKRTCCSVSFFPPYGDGKISQATDCSLKPKEARHSGRFPLGISHVSVSSESWELGSCSLSSPGHISHRTGKLLPSLQEYFMVIPPSLPGLAGLKGTP